MPKTVTRYTLLISCPSDIEEELEIINETVDDFNQNFGLINDIQISTKHWSKDSFPQSGGSPQSLLNSQIVFDCDAAIAVFWTRFGTPTETYDSGTEEEIEELIKSGKQVFLYFSDRPTTPSSFNSKQYNKVSKFREKYSDQGIYHPYSDLVAFKKNLSNHLTLYFLKLITNENPGKTEPTRSNLSVKGVFNGKLTDDTVIAMEKNYLDASLLIDSRNEISMLINNIKDVPLTSEVKLNDGGDKNENSLLLSRGLIKPNIKYSGFLFEVNPIKIEKSLEMRIREYASKQNIDIEEEFFNLGELGQQNSPQPNILGIGSASTLTGTEEEKNKYKLIKELSVEIKKYQEWFGFLDALSSQFRLELALTNFGSSFDEDIDVSIYIPKGLCYKVDEVLLPGDSILETVNDYIDVFFKPVKSRSIKEYEDYPTSMSSFTPPIHNLLQTYAEEVERNRRIFKETLEDLFCYEYFTEGNYDVIRFTQPYLKQNTNIFFPTVLLLKSKPNSISYEISSKHFPQVVEGEILVRLEHDNN